MSDPVKILRSPCVSCPYRQDVPSGIWSTEEYDKIVPFDNDTGFQPPALFMCHQGDNSLCRGWLDCHGRDLLALRLASIRGEIDHESLYEALGQTPAVPVFSTAAEAAEHGRLDIDEPGEDACRLMARIKNKRGF